ncbi:MAG: flagellin lysine-N-methylase [Oscillospiraceae bacterium]|nr:flagellin lysine-N-methylase [Oscillospiraceae bacterium]
MAEQSRRIPVEEDLRPAYYDDFHCLAEGCKLSCCKGWSITFNKKDYLSLKRQEGSPDLNARMETGLRRLRKGPMAEKFYGEFNMDSGVCPLLREDGLCQLQREKDHAALPDVCRTYPRSETYLYSGYLERSLSPSCEGVLALLWELPDGIEFRSDPLPKSQHKYVNFPEENPLPLYFSVVREWCVDLLQNRRFTLPQRIWIMGMGLKLLADGETDIQRWMERAAVLPDSDISDFLPDGNQELALLLSNCFRTLLIMQSGDPELEPLKNQLVESMRLETHPDTNRATIPLTPYCEARARFEERFGDRDYFMENLMVSIFVHLHMPHMASREALWKSYVNFCNLYAMYRFLSVMSCREGASGDREELFRLIVFASRSLIHNSQRQNQLRDELFQNDSATLAHMAILLSG